MWCFPMLELATSARTGNLGANGAKKIFLSLEKLQHT